MRCCVIDPKPRHIAAQIPTGQPESHMTVITHDEAGPMADGLAWARAN